MLTQEELIQVLVQTENDRVEKTESDKKIKKFGEAICAFSNDLSGHKAPGYLIIGVKDNGKPSGLKVSEELLQRILEFRTNGKIIPLPALATQTFAFPEGDVLVVEVHPSRYPPVRFDQKVCVRVGPRRGIANETEERRLSEKRSFFARTFDLLPCIGSDLSDLSTPIFQSAYLPIAIDPETLAANHRTQAEQLASLKFFDLKDNSPTNAGILMFGKNPLRFLQGAYLQYVRFQGIDETSSFDFEKRFEGDLATQFGVLNDFIKSQIVRRVQRELGAPYESNYPLQAIQELLFNAVIHRDYQSNAPIRFYEFEDRIEIINPGGLFGDARPENFPHTNDYRNPALAEAAKVLGWVNKFNVGVKRAMKALEDNGNPPAEFIKDQLTTFGVKIFKRP